MDDPPAGDAAERAAGHRPRRGVHGRGAGPGPRPATPRRLALSLLPRVFPAHPRKADGDAHVERLREIDAGVVLPVALALEVEEPDGLVAEWVRAPVPRALVEDEDLAAPDDEGPQAVEVGWIG